MRIIQVKTRAGGTTRDHDTDEIYVTDRLRPVDESRVHKLAESMREIGLMTPISVRIVRNMVIKGETLGFVPVLVAGAHRLQAAKSLGWDYIPCIELEATDREVKIWEIVENLHRAELTVQERSDLTTELVRLYAAEDEAVAEKKNVDTGPMFAAPLEKPAQVAQVSGKGGRGVTGGVSAAARELGRDRDSVRRDLKIAATASEAKEAARAAGLGDNQSALLKIAAEPTPEAQVAKVAEIVEHKRSPAAEFSNKRQVEALEAAWKNASHVAREGFLASIEQPDTTGSASSISPDVEAIHAETLKVVVSQFSAKQDKHGRAGYDRVALRKVARGLRTFDIRRGIHAIEEEIQARADIKPPEDHPVVGSTIARAHTSLHQHARDGITDIDTQDNAPADPTPDKPAATDRPCAAVAAAPADPLDNPGFLDRRRSTAAGEAAQRAIGGSAP